jgi:hypothetical protein
MIFRRDGADPDDLSEAEIQSKLREATEIVGAYLSTQTEPEQAHAAVGALRVSAVALFDATDADTTARVLRELADTFSSAFAASVH